jgi:hypothetical protein
MMLELTQLLNQEAQNDALFSVEEKVDLTPCPVSQARSVSHTQRVKHSVVKPGSAPLQAEQAVRIDDSIRYDAEQTRAMIKHFVEGSNGRWTLDKFRLALGWITRPQLTKFLEYEGPREGTRGGVFHLAWEFFHRRDKLLLRLLGADPEKDEGLLQERPAKRRRLLAAQWSRGGKRARRE